MSFIVKFALAGALALAASGPLCAQSLPPGVHLGMSAEELRAVLPDAQRVRRPQRLAGGLAGDWRAAPTVVAGLPFEPTFFFAGSVLRRIEWVASAESLPDRGAEAFAELLAWGRAQFGAETASHDPGSAYAAWVGSDADVYAQHVDEAHRAVLRLVYKARQLKDASEL
jgi:hypothetical protein